MKLTKLRQLLRQNQQQKEEERGATQKHPRVQIPAAIEVSWQRAESQVSPVEVTALQC